MQAYCTVAAHERPGWPRADGPGNAQQTHQHRIPAQVLQIGPDAFCQVRALIIYFKMAAIPTWDKLLWQ